MDALDSLDRKLLHELDCNSRQPLSRMSKKLRQGRDRIDYRVKRLVELGVVRKFTIVVNPYKMGLTTYKTYLKLENNRARLKELFSYLHKHQRIYWYAECSGRWDVIFSTFAENPFEFQTLQDAILSKFSDIIHAFDVFTVVNIWMFRKSYLVDRGSEAFFLGGPPVKAALDRLDYEILKELSLDARTRSVDIAKKFKTTPNIIRYRIEQLEKSGVILGYRVEVDLAKLKMTFFKAQIYLRDYSDSLANELKLYCAKHPNITYYIEQIGACKVELELEVSDYRQYYDIVDELSSKFAKLIRNVETNLIHTEEFKWIPQNFVETLVTA